MSVITTAPATVGRKVRNVLTYKQGFQLGRWIVKHLDFCVSKGMTAVECTAKASNELGFPLTVANLKHVVLGLERTWKFRDPAAKMVTLKDLQDGQRAIARSLADLYGRLGSLEDCNALVLRIAGVPVPDTEDTEGGD